MPKCVNMGKYMMVMPMGFLCTGSMGVLHLMVLRFKRVRYMSDFLFPYRFKYLILGLELIDPDNLAPALTALVVPNQHTIAEKFLAYGRTVRVDYTCKAGTAGLPVHENTPFLGRIITIVLHLLKLIGKFIDIFGLHMDMEEFIGDSIPAKIIMVANLSFNFNKIPKTNTATPTPVTLKLRHSNLKSLLIGLITFGYILKNFIGKNTVVTRPYNNNTRRSPAARGPGTIQAC